jgi:hypothetical protein
MSLQNTREEMVAQLVAAAVPAADWLSGLEKAVASLEPPPMDSRPEIVLPGDGKSVSVFAGELARKLSDHGGIFVRDNIPLYISPSGKLEPMGPEAFCTWIEDHVCPVKMAGTGKERHLEPATMTAAGASLVLNSPQFLRELRPIRRVNLVRQPVIRKSGALELLPAGYDAEAECFTVNQVAFDEGMALDDALVLIDGLLSEFAWPREETLRAKAIAISAMLATFGDMMLESKHQRPVFIFGANREGAGKTLLIRFAVCPTFGPAVIGPPPNAASPDQLSKLLASAALGGAPYLIFDNWTGVIGNSSLEAFITSSTYSDRVLGVSKMFSVEKQCLVFISGNHARVSPDMRRRSLMVDLEVVEACSEDRPIQNPIGEPEILARRPEILAALWSIICHWNEAGRPVGSVRHGSFAKWGHHFGGIMESIGLPNPCAAPTRAADDTLRDMQVLVVEALESAIEEKEGRTFTASELMEFSRERGLFEWVLSEEAPDREDLKRRERSSFGKICARFDGSKFGTIEFVKAGEIRSGESKVRVRQFVIRRVA